MAAIIIVARFLTMSTMQSIASLAQRRAAWYSSILAYSYIVTAQGDCGSVAAAPLPLPQAEIGNHPRCHDQRPASALSSLSEGRFASTHQQRPAGRSARDFAAQERKDAVGIAGKARYGGIESRDREGLNQPADEN